MEAYCSYEICKLLKKKGFDEPCMAFWEYELSEYSLHISSESPINNSELENKKEFKGFSAPTHQMACAWLREVHNMHIDIDPSEGDWHPCIIELETWSAISDGNLHICDTYEKAVEAALKYVLENLI